MHLGDKGPFKAPFVESMGDIPNPYRDELFYYVLGDELNRMQKAQTQSRDRKNWKWAEVRCDVVNGFVPHASPYNLPGLYMNFLSLYRWMHEAGHADAASTRVPFPSAPACYHTRSNDGGQDVFARFSLHLCLHAAEVEVESGELFNIGDEARPRTFAERWPAVCALYGLEGVAPVEPGSAEYRTPVRFARAHPEEVRRLEEEKGVRLQGIWLEEGLEMWMEHFNFDHDLVLNKARATGFTEELRFDEAWRLVFERYARAKKAYLGSERVVNGDVR